MSSNYEREELLLKGLLWRLPPDAQERLIACRSSHRFMAYKNKILVIYSLIGDHPRVHDRLTCEAASISLEHGLSSTWSSSTSGETLTIGHVPVEVAPNCFLHHTIYSAVDFLPYRNIYAAKFSLVYRTQHHPKSYKPDCLYMQELASYQAEFQKGIV